MRSSILIQSALGGAFVGLLAAVVLVAAGALLQLLLPDGAARALGRLAPVVVPVVAALCVAGGAVLGWLEGRLKL